MLSVCIECRKQFASPTTMRRHHKSKHGRELSARNGRPLTGTEKIDECTRQIKCRRAKKNAAAFLNANPESCRAIFGRLIDVKPMTKCAILDRLAKEIQTNKEKYADDALPIEQTMVCMMRNQQATRRMLRTYVADSQPTTKRQRKK